MGKLKHRLSVGTGVLECLTGAGLIFGWASMDFILTKEGYFKDTCPTYIYDDQTTVNITAPNITLVANDSLTLNTTSQPVTTNIPVVDPTCETTADNKQKESLTFVFTVASIALSFSTILNGALFDRFGTFVSRMLATFLFASGCVMMAVSTPEQSWIVYPAMCCFSVGGILALVTNIQLGNLFSNKRGSIITAMNGALDSSSFIFLAVKLIYDVGFSLYTIFVILSMLALFQLVRTIVLMPVKLIPFPLPKDFDYGVLHHLRTRNQPRKMDDTELSELTKSNDTKQEVEVLTSEVMAFRDCFKCVSFWLNITHMSVLQLRNYFYLATFPSHLATLIPEDSSIGPYINIFGICQLFGICAAPFNGLLVDFLLKMFKKRAQCSSHAATCRALGWSHAVTCFLAVIFSISCAVPHINVQYLSFVLQVIFRSFLYGGNANFLAMFYPIEHFGKLYGVTMTLAGVVGLLQFPLYTLLFRTLEGDFFKINIIFIAVSALTLVHPIALIFKSKQQTANSKEGGAETQALTM